MFKGITLDDFNSFFQNENICRLYLFKLKWAEGYLCRKCGNDKSFSGRTQFHARCSKCKYDESITAHTVFHRIQFPLLKAFKMAFQIAVFKKGISSVELGKIFRVNQKTAWAFKRKIQESMGEGFSANSPERIDRSFKKVDGIILMNQSKKLRGLQRIDVEVQNVDCIKPKRSFVRCNTTALDRETIQPCHLIAGRYVDDGKDIRMWNFKGWLTGIHHHCSEKYLSGYLHEYFFRYSRRKAENFIFHELIYCMIRTKPYSFQRTGGGKV